jgi:hypothetical protein
MVFAAKANDDKHKTTKQKKISDRVVNPFIMPPFLI